MTFTKDTPLREVTSASPRRDRRRRTITFLAWESPWPSLCGGDLRTMGLLRQLHRWYDIDLMVFSREPLRQGQWQELGHHASTITNYRLRNRGVRDLLANLLVMLKRQCPYHCAVAYRSVALDKMCAGKLWESTVPVYASYGQWGTLALEEHENRWILDQHNADIHFWSVYAATVSSKLRKILLRINGALARRHYPGIYRRVEKIVSVCDADRALTAAYCPEEKVHVIENGVDCSEFAPGAQRNCEGRRLLFTGTSHPRNMAALRWFIDQVFPKVLAEKPDVVLVVGGDFSRNARLEFRRLPRVMFTGRLGDMRPLFDNADIFIAPFLETHGSKLKIAEAMAMGMCIVSTPEGVRGFQLKHDESVVIAGSDAEFAKQVVALLGQPERRKQIGGNARQAALETIDWSTLGVRLYDVVEDAVTGDLASAGEKLVA